MLNSSQIALLNWGFGTEGFIGWRGRFPVWAENILRRNRKWLGTTANQAAGNAFTAGRIGLNGFYLPAGKAKRTNSDYFQCANGSIPLLWTGDFPPTDDATVITNTDYGETCRYNTPFPPSLDDHGDCMMDIYYALARLPGNVLQFLAYDLETGITYHGPQVAYTGAGITALVNDIVFGGDTPGTFPPVNADTGFNTSMIGEMGLFRIHAGPMANADTMFNNWLRLGVDYVTAFGVAPILAIDFTDGAGSFSNAVTWNGGTTQLTVASVAGYAIGDTVYQTAAVGAAFSTATAVGTIISINATTSKMIVRTTSGTFVTAPVAQRPLYDCTTPGSNTNVTTVTQYTAPSITVQGEIFPASSARNLNTKGDRPHRLKSPCLVPVPIGSPFTSMDMWGSPYGTTNYNDSTAVGADQTAGTAAIQPTITGDGLAHVYFLGYNGQEPLSAGRLAKPMILGGKVCDLHNIGARRLALVDELMQAPRNWFIIENCVAGTGEYQEMADQQSDLADINAVTNGSPAVFCERMWSDRERILGLLGTLSPRGLYWIQILLHYWGSATNSADFDNKFGAIHYGIPSMTGQCKFNTAMVNNHHNRDGKTLDPDFVHVIMPFPRAVDTNLFADGDLTSSIRGKMHDSMVAWGIEQHPDTVFVGPSTNTYYLASWNSTMVNPPSATHSQIDLAFGTTLVCRRIAQGMMMPMGTSRYKGRSYPAWQETNPLLAANKKVRFLDDTRMAILIPIAGPWYQQLLSRINNCDDIGFDPVGAMVWGFEFKDGPNGTMTPVGLLTNIYDRQTIIAVKSNGQAFDPVVGMRYRPGGVGTYNFETQAPRFLDASGNVHAAAAFWREEFYVKYCPTFGRFELDTFRDNTRTFYVGAPA